MMWNKKHIEILKNLINISNYFDENRRNYDFSKAGNILIDCNRACRSFVEILDLEYIDEINLNVIHRACIFLIREFAHIDDSFDKEPRINEKSRIFTHARSQPPEALRTLAREYGSIRYELDYRPIDILFVTALSVEFMAIVRRITYYVNSTDPIDFPIDFMNSPEFNYKTRWVQGFIQEGEKLSSVIVACCARDGSLGSMHAANDIIQLGIEPKYIFVVGISASLNQNSGIDIFNLGDIGIAKKFTDITRGKYTAIENINVTQYKEIDYEICIENLSFIQKVIDNDNWQNKTHIERPQSLSNNKREAKIITHALSGSDVVKDTDEREKLRVQYPNSSMLEIEAAGVASVCHREGLANPIIIKSACDNADTGADKSLQPYCADGAAAFAVELALELALELEPTFPRLNI